MTRNRLLLIQTGTPPAAIREEHGDLPHWFRTLLAPWQAQLTAVRVFEDEPLPAPDRQTVAVLTGSWAMVSDRLAWSERTPTGSVRRWLSACRCSASAMVIN